MRNITQQEAAQWMALAEDRGLVNDDGEVALGRFQVEEAPRARASRPRPSRGFSLMPARLPPER